MNKIDKLTPEQIAKIPIYRDMYINKFFVNNKEANFEEVKEYVDWIYELSNLKKPLTILVNSPYECLIAYQYLKILLPNVNQVKNQVTNQVENQVWNQVWNQVENQVWNQVWNQVGNQVRNQVWNQVKNQVMNQVMNQVRNQVGDQVRNQVWNQVRNQVENQFENQVWNQVANQVMNQVGNQVWNQVGNQVRNQVWNQVMNQIGDQAGDQVKNQVKNQVWNQVGNQVANQVENQVWNQVENQVWNQVENQVENQVRNQVWNQVRNQVWNQVGNQVWNQVGNQVVNQVRNQVENQVVNQVWNKVENQVMNQVRNQVENQVENQVGDQVWNQVENQVGNQVGDQVKNQVWNQVMNQVGNQVMNQVMNQVVNQVRNQFKNNKLEWLDICYYFSSFNSWISYIDYFNNEVLDLKQKDIFNKYKKVLDLNILWSITLENVCIVSKNAIDYQRNSNFQLHSLNKPAITFPGNDFQYKLYFIQGVGISEELFYKLQNKEYTFEDWTKEENEEIKSVVLAFYEEKFGGEFVFRFLSKHLKEIDNYVDKKDKQYLKGTVKSMNIGVYTLFKGNVNNTIVAYVRCYCPSTDRMFFLGVHPDFTNAKDAIASLCQIPAKLKDNLLSISRQGNILPLNMVTY